MNILILTADSNGCYPVPAVRGGAVSTLIEHLVDENNKKQMCKMEIVSFYDPIAHKKAISEYPNIKFYWIAVPLFFKIIDKFIFKLYKIFRKNGKAISFRSPMGLLWYILKAKKIVEHSDADKIVIENNIPLALIMKRNNFKGSWYYHFHNIPRINVGCGNEFQKVKKFLCVSHFVADKIESEDCAIGRISKNKIKILYNCVDTDLFRPIMKEDVKIDSLRKKYKFNYNDFICIFTGRLSEEKGPDKMLEALLNMPSNVKCLIVGSLFSDFNSMTEYQKKLYDTADRLGDRVVFTGFISQKELPYYYNLADVAILPSMWDEPAGLTNLEAMSCGIPIITTQSGGIPEYVENCGFVLCRNESLVTNIVQSINKIMAGDKMCDLEEPVKRVLAKFGKNNYLEKFLNSLE